MTRSLRASATGMKGSSTTRFLFTFKEENTQFCAGWFGTDGISITYALSGDGRFLPDHPIRALNLNLS